MVSDLRIVVGDFLSQRDAVHVAGHDDVAENKIDLVAASQPVQRVGGISRLPALPSSVMNSRLLTVVVYRTGSMTCSYGVRPNMMYGLRVSSADAG